MRVEDLGLCPYPEAERLQRLRLGAVAAGDEPVVLLMEHPPVITFGRHGGEEHLHAGREWLASRGVAVAKAARGGKVTCHFPGQLVAYPLVLLKGRSGGLRSFFADLEASIIATAEAFGVNAFSREGLPGVWTDWGKLASIGVALKRWTTWHGLALNVASDLWLFEAITLCGLEGAAPTSLSREAGREIAVNDVKGVLADAITRRFAYSALA